MKKLFLKFLFLFPLLGLFGCDNSLEYPTTGNVQLVNTPELYVYSGNSSTRAIDQIVTSSKVKGSFNQDSYNNQQSKVNEYLQEGSTNLDHVDLDFLYYAENDLTFELYALTAVSSHKPNYLGLFYYDEYGEIHKQIIWDDMNPNFWDTTWTPDGTLQNVEGVQVTVKAGYKFGFYWEGKRRPGEGSYNDEICEYYSLSELNTPQKDYDSDNIYSSHAGTFVIDGKTYLGLEDWYDYDYQDWVFFFDKEITKVNPSDKLPNITPEVTNPEEPTTPNTPEVNNTLDHVEVNLSIEERPGIEWLASHLSIHVRAITDVEVFIPLPVEYYCAVDDLAIVHKHNNLMIHGGPEEVTYNVNGHEVILTLNFEERGIYVTTNGINEDVINYCRNTYGDGLNFEVWSYMNLKVKEWSDINDGHGRDVFMNPNQENAITPEQLRDYLNQSTIRFLNNPPTLYVNAFMYQPGCDEGEHTCGKFINDCTVLPIGVEYIKQENEEGDYWYNSSPYNQLYFIKQN